MTSGSLRFTDADLDFLVSVVAPDVKDKAKLRQLIQQDEDFRDSFIGDKRTFRQVVADEELFLKISPRLYFEILLRKARKEMEAASHTIEIEGTKKIAVFDTKEVVELISRQPVLLYLAEMLSSFTKIESYSISYRVRKGIWRKIRFNDLDIDSLTRFCESVDEEHRLGFFKRIADICLFMLGVFPGYVQFSYRYPSTGELRPQQVGRVRRNATEYLEEGRKFYKLAAEHPAAGTYGLSEVFWLFHANFHAAQKPLNFIAEHYLHYKKHSMFGIQGQ
ncbi:MAG: hypothetical protein JSV47_03580 [Deltaproteobacteria bacterium]|nr:MAG: hypothetical protein JSV47_03580 [Deltaproteobacteria bacterium]